MTNGKQREAIAATSLNAAIAFVRSFGRVPDERERDLLMHAVVEYFNQRDARSTTTLQ
ncbi:hypothetical protein Rleg10DRAFT_6394 [Rhizobium leguminosarum bv. trifolii WSM2012]|nr:hypothetical protein Rleg10DRAFT_6394 [Rhizobium leguminosarum bv. trifolii WSM2012]